MENLIALKYLLENKKKIIAISKTSSSNEIFHANIPDMAILDGMTRKQGFSEPYHRKVTYKTKHDFPIENEFFRELWFTIFFARLDDNKNIIKIELPYYTDDLDEIREILKVLKSNNVQLIVPARGATPAITGHFEVNYILGQKLIDGRQQTVVVDYRSQTEETELEYAALEYEQETFQFF